MEVTQPKVANEVQSQKQKLIELFSVGFDDWLKKRLPDGLVFRLETIKENPLGRAQLNQLLHLCHEPGVSAGFFRYYWLTDPPTHPYEVNKLPGFDQSFFGGDLIVSLEHLRWGLYRLYVDALLYFGDGRIAFKKLRTRSLADLTSFYGSKRFDSVDMARRGPAIPLVNIAKDNRYLISEMACKSYGSQAGAMGDLKKFLLDAYAKYGGSSKTTVRKILEAAFAGKTHERQTEFLFSAESILEEEIENAMQFEEKYEAVARLFQSAREGALKNTEYFLSMVNDLDVYVATSMRTRGDFRKMAEFCEKVLRAPSLKHLSLRYFDPTVSAAEGHEDKGLIECLMVKSAKVLVYCAGEKDSFGKDAEAAMALSLGKPVIFYCDEGERQRFFSEVHPLSRLIEFKSGIAVGAMVTSSQDEVVKLLGRIFENRMEYELHQKSFGIRLIERLTKSTVRLQTKNELLRETFWNYYNAKV